VLASAVAYVIYFTLLDRLGPFEINLVSYVVPVVATVTGAVLLAEPVTALTIAGFAVIVVGFGLLKAARDRRRGTAASPGSAGCSRNVVEASGVSAVQYVDVVEDLDRVVLGETPS